MSTGKPEPRGRAAHTGQLWFATHCGEPTSRIIPGPKSRRIVCIAVPNRTGCRMLSPPVGAVKAPNHGVPTRTKSSAPRWQIRKVVQERQRRRARRHGWVSITREWKAMFPGINWYWPPRRTKLVHDRLQFRLRPGAHHRTRRASFHRQSRRHRTSRAVRVRG